MVSSSGGWACPQRQCLLRAEGETLFQPALLASQTSVLGLWTEFLSVRLLLGSDFLSPVGSGLILVTSL